MKFDSSTEPRRKRSQEMSDKEARDIAKASKKRKQIASQVGINRTGDGDVLSNSNTARSPPKNMGQNKTHKPTVSKPKGHSKFANISHKHSTGATNWQKFLQDNQEGVRRPTVKNTSADHKTSALAKVSADSAVKMTKVLGMDCEMVGVGEDGRDSVLARVSIVNVFGDCVYDKYVKSRENVTDYRTYVSGIREEDLVNGEDFDTVQREVADILRRRILVGHAIKNDLEVLFLSHPRSHIRDTAKFFRKGGCKTPSLKTLAAEYLDVTIQEGEHSSVQDAKAAVMLYNLYKKQWELGGGNRKHNRIDTYHNKVRSGHQNLVDDT